MQADDVPAVAPPILTDHARKRAQARGVPMRIAASKTPLRVDKLSALVELRLPTDQERWTDGFDLEAGPWAIHLTGSAVPTPRLVISLRGDQVRMPSVDPFLTLVRPAEGFETVNLDSSGIGEVALPTGHSVMLLQADEVWEVRLSFGDFSWDAR
jgi:hypothetical protein